MNTEQFTIREARDEELMEVIQVLSEGFTEDPVNNYIGGVKARIQVSDTSFDFRALRAFMNWQVRISRIHCGGRIMIAVDRVGGKDRIIAGSIWNAPGKRVQFSLKELMPLYHAGTLDVLRYWGLSGRMIAYFPKAEAVFEEEWRQRNIATSIDDTWQCWTVVVLPAYRGKGLLTSLFREFFSFAPDKTLVLEATSEDARDKYKHLGFETLETVHYGQGRTDGAGIVASGEKATGFKVYPMVRWGIH
ncbi:hypothetical protein GYMLUDRAFT_262747 [Collybiopsis luxurians FD-317 M1]|uniref:N-acetyltransferase domain-containing protein n=1 Tax=Collybiopsis luxurians FD-317 M1 TaxID=944289 RepID=A0A0D0CHV7_9AGAR|nr:hypothetical protein GYMLUDRAFT_262747 [Collybiopsis luxurians FD-317 M1]